MLPVGDAPVNIFCVIISRDRSSFIACEFIRIDGAVLYTRISGVMQIADLHFQQLTGMDMLRQGLKVRLLGHLTKSCSHMITGEFLVKQPVRFEPLAYFPNWRILREYSTGE